jgi:cysteine-rich repeat protein
MLTGLLMKILSLLRSALLVPLLAAPASAEPDLSPEILSVEVAENDSVDEADVVEGCAGDRFGRRLIHFGLRTENQGSEDLVMGDPECPNCSLEPGASCANPLYVCSTAHGHEHFEEYALAELLDGSGQVVAEGVKQGFCLLDSDCASPTYHCGFQGISAGCADVYGAGLPCQYIDITDLNLPGGTYTLRVTVDFANLIEEEDEANNTAEAPVVLGGPPPAGCGNGEVEPGEACDDGNTRDGDCCASDCAEAAPDGSACSEPGSCLEAGSCQAGLCSGTPSCDPCLQCRPPDGCVPPPSALCETLPPKKSKLSLRDKFNRPGRDSLSWSWTSGAPVGENEFGAPAETTDLHMCIYDEAGLAFSATAPSAGTCGSKPCWKQGRNKLRYSNNAATPDGLRKLELESGDSGKARIKVAGKGENLGFSGLDLEGEVTVRLRRSDGTPCWEASYPVPTHSDGTRYEARSKLR